MGILGHMLATTRNRTRASVTRTRDDNHHATHQWCVQKYCYFYRPVRTEDMSLSCSLSLSWAYPAPLFLCWSTSKTKRWNLGLTLHPPILNKTRNLPPCHFTILPLFPSYHLTTFAPFPPCQLLTTPSPLPPPFPTCQVTALQPLQPCCITILPPFPPSQLTTFPPFPPSHYLSHLPCSLPFHLSQLSTFPATKISL